MCSQGIRAPSMSTFAGRMGLGKGSAVQGCRIEKKGLGLVACVVSRFGRRDLIHLTHGSSSHLPAQAASLHQDQAL
jgi:hypothetical protein